MKLKFNSVIIDPPKKEIMLYIYNYSFLIQLAKFIHIHGLISCYVPKGTLKSYQEVLYHIIELFESTNYFQFYDKIDEFIYIFQRI